MSGISVSATKRPPNRPNIPCSSGPVRKELGSAGWFTGSSPRRICARLPGSGGEAFLRLPDGPEECVDQRRVLDARRALDAGRHVDSGRVGQSQGIADIGGAQATGKHVIHIPVKGGEDAPVEGYAVAARQGRA